MEGRNYFANHIPAPQIIQGAPSYNLEVSDGNTPPGNFYPATYLKVRQFEERIGGSWFVLMPGTPVALDSNKRLVPAGLAWEKELYDAAHAADLAAGAGHNATTAKAAGEAAVSITYGDKDEQAGVVGATGAYATSGDKVASLMGDAGIGVTRAVGFMRYSALMAPGSDPSDPSTFYRHAYDTGGARAFMRRFYIQMPIVEVNAREEAVTTATTSHRIALYTDGTPITFYKGGVLVGAMTQKATINLMTEKTAGDPDQFAVVGRTVFFNAPVPANYSVRYTPKTDLPFVCLKASYGAGVIGKDLTEKGLKDYLGAQISYNVESNYQVVGTAGANTRQIGEILDVKEGSSKDLALVRTYFRDFGLWQEAPGSATDGRNAYLAIANAPRYIARVAVDFWQF